MKSIITAAIVIPITIATNVNSGSTGQLAGSVSMQIANLCLSFVSRCIVCICWFRRFELSAFVYLRILALARPHKDGSRPEPAPHTDNLVCSLSFSRPSSGLFIFFQLCCIVKLVEYIKKPFCHVGRLVNDLTQFFSLRPFHLVARGKI